MFTQPQVIRIRQIDSVLCKCMKREQTLLCLCEDMRMRGRPRSALVELTRRVRTNSQRQREASLRHLRTSRRLYLMVSSAPRLPLVKRSRRAERS